jgi:hypothetical protein
VSTAPEIKRGSDRVDLPTLRGDDQLGPFDVSNFKRELERRLLPSLRRLLPSLRRIRAHDAGGEALRNADERQVPLL